MLFGSLRVSALQWLGNLAIGLLAALAWHVNPAGLVLVAVPLGLVYLAYREWVAGPRRARADGGHGRAPPSASPATATRPRACRWPAARAASRSSRRASTACSSSSTARSAATATCMKEASAELHEPVRAIRRELALLGRRDDEDETAAAASGSPPSSTASTRSSARWRRSRAPGRPGAVRPAPVALDPFLERVGDRARVLLDDRLTVATLPGDAVARLDATWVERALLHMLDNAAIHGRCSSP